MPVPSPAWRPHTAAQTAYLVKRNKRSPIVPSVSPKTWSTQLYSEGPWYSTIVQLTKFSHQSILRARGHPPLANGREAPQTHNRSVDNFYAIKQFAILKGYATQLGARENPLPTTGAEPCPVGESLRAPRASQTNSTSYYAGEFYQTRKFTLQNTMNWLNKITLQTGNFPRG